MQSQSSVFNQRLSLGIKLLLACNIFLLIISVLTYPPVLKDGGLLGLAADIGILSVYGYLTLVSPIAVGKLPYPVWRRGVYLGIIAGVVLSLDLISGYILHNPTVSAQTSLAAYGLFLLLILGAGFVGTYQAGKLAAGLTTAIWCVLIALLIWFCVEFAAYLIFSNTPSGAAFIQEEMQADYIRSGMSDYQAFALSDFFGAGFFHLLLGLIFAVVLGSIGGVIAKRIPHKTESILPT